MMMNTKLIHLVILLAMIRNAHGNGKGGALCDVAQWYDNLTQHIDKQEIDLNGGQSSTLRKIRQFIEEYDNKIVMRPCYLLTKYGSIIIEDNDEETIDYSQFEAKADQTTSKKTDSRLGDDESEEPMEVYDSNRIPGKKDDKADEHLKVYDSYSISSTEEKDDNSVDDESKERVKVHDPNSIPYTEVTDNDNNDRENVQYNDENDPGVNSIPRPQDSDNDIDDAQNDVENDSIEEEDPFSKGNHAVKSQAVAQDDVSSEELEIDPTDLSSLEDEDDDSDNEEGLKKDTQDMSDSKKHNTQDFHKESSLGFCFPWMYNTLNITCFEKDASWNNDDVSVTDHDEKRRKIKANLKYAKDSDAHQDKEYDQKWNVKVKEDFFDENRESSVQLTKVKFLTVPKHRKHKVSSSQKTTNNCSFNLYLNHFREDFLTKKLLFSKNQGNKMSLNSKCVDIDACNKESHIDAYEATLSRKEEVDDISSNVISDRNIMDDTYSYNKGSARESSNVKQNVNEGMSDNLAESTTINVPEMSAKLKEQMLKQKSNNENEITEDQKVGASENSNNNMNQNYVNEESSLKSTSINVQEISAMLKQQELEQERKIEQLKLEIIKVENKLLTQSLDLKSDTNTVNHLENHILKLENNLLKLNQSYNKLQRDHNSLKRKQLFDSNIQTSTNVQPKTNNNTELITQQKSRIWELSQIIANQTLNIQQIQRKSSYLEEQNQHLFKIVMDQTALVSNILSQIQEMNENHVKTKLETKELRLLFDYAIEKHGTRTSDDNVPPHPKSNGKVEKSTETSQPSNHIPSEASEQKSDIQSQKLQTRKEFTKSHESEKSAHRNDGKIPEENGNEKSKEFIGGESEMFVTNVGKTAPSLDQPIEVHLKTDEKVNESTNKMKNQTDKHSSEKNQLQDNRPLRNKTNNAKTIEDKDEKLSKEDAQNNTKQRRVPNQAPIHSILYSHSQEGKSYDCYDLYQTKNAESGMNKIYISGLDMSVNALCDMDDGGWTVLLRRDNGDEDFYKDYNTYKEGFGSHSSDHYMGNEVIHYLTNQKHYSLKVKLTDWDGQTKNAIYDSFWLDGENDHFRLHVHGYSGTAGDGLTKHSGMKFSTFDVDNDLLKTELGGSCAKRFQGAGWYYKCYQSNLMGVYYKDGKIPEKRYDGITWKPWKGANYSMKSVTLSIRPKGV